MSDPTPSRYQWTYGGVSFDFYRLCEVLGIQHHAQAHALKKVIRAGRSVKSVVQDIDESIACLQRWREMVVEDEGKRNVYGAAVAAVAEDAVGSYKDLLGALPDEMSPQEKWNASVEASRANDKYVDEMYEGVKD